jgi:TPR repeat protein
MADMQEQIYSIYQEIEKLKYGQASALERLLKQAIAILSDSSEAGDSTVNFQLLFRLNHTLNKEVWMANNQKSITKSTSKDKIRQQEEAFKTAKDQVLYELIDFKHKPAI